MTTVFADVDACVTPVLPFAEVPEHPHAAARGTVLDVDGTAQPAPAPRISRTPAARPRAPRPDPVDAGAVLTAWAARGAHA